MGVLVICVLVFTVFCIVCNVWVCMCGFVMCECVYVWICNVWECVCVSFVMCGCFGNMFTCIYCFLYRL